MAAEAPTPVARPGRGPLEWPPVETAALLVLSFFGLLNLFIFHRFKKPLLPVLLALFVSFFVFFLAPALGLLVFLLGQSLAFYQAGRRA